MIRDVIGAAPPVDVVIVGGGTAAAATALACRRAGVEDVCLIGDATVAVPIGESIPPDTGLLLRELGVWDDFVGQRHEQCLGSCSAWGDDRLGYNDFVLNPHGFGWHLDRRRFDELLTDAARSAGTCIIRGRVADCAELPDSTLSVSYTAADGASRQVRSRFVVDASGPAAVAALALGARRNVLDRLMFVYGFFDAPATGRVNRLTLLEADTIGWWYCAALPHGRTAIALATDSATLRANNLATADEWRRRLKLTKYLAPRLADAQQAGELVVRNASSCILDRMAGQRWVAVGDAASTLDPIASQGIHKALEDAIAAAAAIADGLDGRALITFTDLIASRYEEYLGNRHYLYRLEQRWPIEGFWRRRQSVSATRA